MRSLDFLGIDPSRRVLLELRHVGPEAFGHVGHAALGVVAGLDGDGVVKAPPQSPARFDCIEIV